MCGGECFPIAVTLLMRFKGMMTGLVISPKIMCSSRRRSFRLTSGLCGKGETKWSSTVPFSFLLLSRMMCSLLSFLGLVTGAILVGT